MGGPGELPDLDLPSLARSTFGLELSDVASARLAAYVDLVADWSKKMNLVSAGSCGELVERHVLDSLAAATVVADGESFADIGSGAGLPGIPLAIVRRCRGWLVESRRRRVSFLRHALRALELPDLQIFEGRAERFDEGRVDVAIARAVSPDVVEGFAAAGLLPGGRIALLRKASQPDPAVAGFAITARRAYVLPGGERHEVVTLGRCFT
jgi:16S rRNA (guanine527-N7)-methyltransferase